MSTVDALEQVRAYVAQVLAQVAAQPSGPASVGTAPCQGRAGEAAPDDRFYTHAVQRVPLDEGTHAATVERLRDRWTSAGYTVVDDRRFGGDEATLTVRDPATGYQVALTSTRPPRALVVQVFSPCWRRSADP